LVIGKLQNEGVMELQGTMFGTIDNRGDIYIGNMTAAAKSGARQFLLVGDYNQNADTGQLIFYIGTLHKNLGSPPIYVLLTHKPRRFCQECEF